MRALVVRRLLMSVPLVLIVSFVTFLLQALAPGDTARTILGNEFTQEQYDLLRQQLGLDQPLLAQYWHWLSNAITGDLGTSPISGLGVSGEIGNRLAVSLSLIIGATLVAAVLGVALGVAGAVRGGLLARALDALTLIGFALPSFWLGLVLVTVFAVVVRLLPATGYIAFAQSPGGWVQSLVLPVAALTVHGVAVVAKQTRDGMLEALSGDYVHSLRANGASELSIIFRHAVRNAAVPLVTVLGVVFVNLLNGTVLVEAVFAMPGPGGLAVQSTTMHDLPMIQGVALVFTIVVVLVNLLVDIAYGWLNPKVRVR
jgi:peptide/nickel transport system permease protein